MLEEIKRSPDWEDFRRYGVKAIAIAAAMLGWVLLGCPGVLS